MSGLQPVSGCGVPCDVPLSAVLRLSRYLLLLAGFISGGCLLCTAAAAQDVGISVPRPFPVPVAGYEISRLEVSESVRQQTAKVRFSSVLMHHVLPAIGASLLRPPADYVVVGWSYLLVAVEDVRGGVSGGRSR